MINNKYIVIVFLLFSIVFNIGSSLKIEDVSLNKIPSKRYYSGSGCVFEFVVLCTLEIASDSCDNLILGSGVVLDSQTVLYSNSTSRVISLRYFSIPSDQDIAFTFNSNQKSTYKCLEPNFSNIKVKVLKTFSYPNTDVMALGTIVYFELEGLESDVSYQDIGVNGSCINYSPCDITSTLQNSKFILKIPSINKVLPNIIEYSIPTNYPTAKNNIIKIPIVRENYNILEIKSYMDSNTSPLPLFGFNEYPLISLKLNTTVDNGFPIIISNSTNENIQIYPIEGDESSTSYLVPFIGTAFTKLDILYQSGSNTIISSSIEGFYIPFIPFPFGFSYINGFDCIFNASFPIRYQLTQEFHSIIYKLIDGGVILNILRDDTFIYDQSNSPKVGNIDTIKLDNNNYLVRVSAQTYYKFAQFSLGNRVIGYESLISGNGYYGVYEFIINPINPEFRLYDQAGGYIDIKKGSVISLNPLKLYTGLYNQNNDFDINLIQNVSYLYNNLDVTNFTRYNVFYFNYSDSVSRDTSFTLYPSNSRLLSSLFKIKDYKDGNSQSFISKWNGLLKLFEIEFFIEANSDAGNYNFVLFSPDSLNPLYSQTLNVQLKILKTKFDNYGPIFKEIKKELPSKILPSSSSVFGWQVTIEDSINGFKSGYALVMGQFDHSIYNISLDLENGKLNSGSRYLNQYDIKVNISYPCKSQDYVISQVVLYDVMGRLSYFSQGSIEYSKVMSVYNPFINYLQDSSINKISLECQDDLNASVDTTPPVLISFSASTNQIDVNSIALERTVKFIFSAADQESGMKNDVYPIVYLSNSNNQILECKSKIVEIKDKEASYECSIEVPLGFAFPDTIYLSVYNFINRNGIFSGFNTLALVDLKFSYNIFTTLGPIQLILTGNSEISSKGGNLLIYGRGFNQNSSAYITYSNDVSTVIKGSIFKSETVISIPNIQPTTKPFSVVIQNSDSNSILNSNQLIITPINYQYNISQINCNNNGVAKSNGECICNSNWITTNPTNECSTPIHYISSSSQVSSLTGGTIELGGWFGDIHNNPILYIDNKLIPTSSIKSISSSSIITTIGPGNIGPIKIRYTQNDYLWSGIVYPYLVNQIECPSKCSINGECDKTTGKCLCKSGYTGIDCSSPINNDNNNTESQVDNYGTTIISNQDIGYLISIDSIVELDLNNIIVSSFNLSNNWRYVNKNGTVTTFNQTRVNPDQTGSLILLIIEEVNDKDKDFTFAGAQFTVSKGGFKLSLSILNWQYESNLNILQVQISSDIKVNNKYNCNYNDNNAIIESSSNNNYLSNNINYLKVTKNGKAFYARFQDKVLANDRSTTVLARLSSNSDSNSIKVLLTLPHAEKILIDPDFSLLVTQDYQSNCKDSKRWLVGVIVAACALFLVFFISILIIYRKTTFLKITIYKIKKQFKRNN